MSIYKYIERLRYIDYLIHHRISGPPAEFAKKLDISKRNLYNILYDIKLLGGELYYDKVIQSYVYEEDKKLILEFRSGK